MGWQGLRQWDGCRGRRFTVKQIVTKHPDGCINEDLYKAMADQI
uniref:Uncharacterized protein n=1 Tax=Caenorhabditis japonica TaxID=281687 RepID=A0A8R1ING9_CAEJA